MIYGCHLLNWVSIITKLDLYNMSKQADIACDILKNAEGAVAFQVFKDAGVSNETLRRLVLQGVAEKPAARHYALHGRIDILDADWVAFSLQVPDGVIGLLSAAVHHEMTQELSAHPQAFVPRSRTNSITLGGDSGAYFETISSRNKNHLSEGVETVIKSGTPVRITSKERTLLDLFIFSPFNSRTTASTARIPEETFLDSLAKCVDDTDFSFDKFHTLAAVFECSSRVAPYTKTLRFGLGSAHSY